MNRRQKKKAATNPRLWRRPSVSANFLVGPEGSTLTKHRMMELGVPVKRIERMHDTLPMLGAPQ